MEDAARNGPTHLDAPDEHRSQRHDLAPCDTQFQDSSSDERLFELLMYGATVETAAQGAGMSRRTAYRRLEDPDFRRMLEEARARVRAAGRSTEGLDWQSALDSGMLDLIREGCAAMTRAL